MDISSDYFEETTNVREFESKILWANIGGYVGMILGISLLQAPTIIEKGYHFLRKKLLKIGVDKEKSSMTVSEKSDQHRTNLAGVTIGIQKLFQ